MATGPVSRSSHVALEQHGVRLEESSPRRGVLVADPEVHVAFSAREDGNMSLVAGATGGAVHARSRFAAAVGTRLEQLVFARQVHGGEVGVVRRADAGRGATSREDAVAEVDALVTSTPEVTLAVLTADCVPVLLAVPGGSLAAVHAGRRGVVAGVVPAAVAALSAPDPAAVSAVIGPAIGGCCYEVDASLMRFVAARIPEAEAQTAWGTSSLDLPAAVRAQLHAAGVHRITDLDVCTRCRADEWFSHRVDRHGSREGRQMALVWREQAPARAGDGA